MCIVLTNGTVYYFKGEQGAERKVRFVFPDGEVHHFEGEQGAERTVCIVYTNGTLRGRAVII